jgi:putative flippase GtrA
MKNSLIIQRVFSFITALGRNAIPFGVVLFGGNSTQSAMVLYFLETLVAILLAAIYVRLRAPAEDPGYAGIASTQTQIITNGRISYRSQTGDRRTLIQNFLLFSLGFSLIPGVFMIVFVLLILHTDISSATITSGMAGIAALQILNFIMEFFTLGTLTPESASNFLKQSMGRSAVIYISVFAGMILAAFVQSWFLVPFATLKTILDVSYAFQRK